MSNEVSVRRIMNAIVPISRFNRGEASKIFDEVGENGCKIVMKNNKPACVLLAPERYDQIMEVFEDHLLFMEAEKRMKTAESKGFVGADEVYKKLDIQESDLKDIEVGIES